MLCDGDTGARAPDAGGPSPGAAGGGPPRAGRAAGRRRAGATGLTTGLTAAAVVTALLSLAVPPATAAPSPLPAGSAPRSPALPGGASVAAVDTSRASPRWFPARPAFGPLLAAPREVALRGSFILADRQAPGGSTTSSLVGAPHLPGTNLEAEVAVGHRIPVVRLQEGRGGRPAVVVGFEVGIFSRFFMESRERDLLNIDFRVGAPVSVRTGPWSARLALYHYSSHLGDDFADRFGVQLPPLSKEGFELLLARRLPGSVRLYGGGELSVHSNRDLEDTAVRWGAEWRPTPADGSRAEGNGPEEGVSVRPFAAVDFRATEVTRGVAGTGRGGVVIRIRRIRLRLEARGHFGPSPMGQFQQRDETFGGLGLQVEI